MNPLEGLVVGWGVNWVVAQIAAANLDENGLKAKFKAFVEGIPHLPKIFDAPIEGAGGQVLDAVAKIIKDQVGVKSMLTALANQDPASAKTALKALLVPVLAPELAAMVAAA